MRGARGPVAAVVTTAVLMVGCGGKEQTLTKPTFVTRGNTICSAALAKITTGAASAFVNKNEVPAGGQIDGFVKQTVVPALNDQIDALEELKAPKDDKEIVDKALAEEKKGRDKILDEPVLLAASEDPFDKFNTLASGYGLDACSSISQRTRGLMSGKG